MGSCKTISPSVDFRRRPRVMCWMCKSFRRGLSARPFVYGNSTSFSYTRFSTFSRFRVFQLRAPHISRVTMLPGATQQLWSGRKGSRKIGAAMVHIRILDISSYSVLCEKQQKGITDFPFVLLLSTGFFWSLALSRLPVNIRCGSSSGSPAQCERWSRWDSNKKEEINSLNFFTQFSFAFSRRVCASIFHFKNI